MLDRRSTAWCHVNAPAEGAPEALRTLSARAGLDKDSVSLSFLLLRKLHEEEDVEDGGHSRGRRMRARIISDAFVVPGYPGRARYACASPGLCLIPASSHLPPGALCTAFPTRERDMKSRAVILDLEEAGRIPRRNEERGKRPFPPGRESAPFARRGRTERRDRAGSPFPQKKDSPKRREGSRGFSKGGKKSGS